jgi:hypothetical protein
VTLETMLPRFCSRVTAFGGEDVDEELWEA